MLDVIYIVDEPAISSQQSDTGYTPNFTMADREAGFSTGAISAAAVAGGAQVLGALSPVVLLAAAAIGNSFSSSRGVSKTEEQDPARQEEARLFAAYIQRHSMTSRQAQEAGYDFQPGHPVVGRAYRKHPLPNSSEVDGRSLYIPSDRYDSILLEERESELIKLLVHLGATKISITKTSSDKTHRAVSGGVSLQGGPLGAGDVSYQNRTEGSANAQDVREFSLSGRAWRVGSKVESGMFFWLSYEPAWKAVVFAREHGGCLSASIELKEVTSFSADKSLELSIRAKLAEGGVQAGMSSMIDEEKNYIVRAEFSQVRDDG
ncbi:hypothetical protein [Pseudomonas sp. PA27(2017)]|uniref:hypothetical protein n=1 Tax=Pseudomonas sp. PA27(2017) TaxID=1932112 RepID=UPI00095B3E6F|nr:hypothetical protein [Pseudomonas sp. PA27(2017)]OLU32839.1 hypothetical protein BVH06_10230 [Pseudomonas sp. PA27(2017)]